VEKKIGVTVVQCQLLSLNKWWSSRRYFSEEQQKAEINERHGLRLRRNLGNGPLSRIREFGAVQIVRTISQKPLSCKSGESGI
jgi:hypothetical protein